MNSKNRILEVLVFVDQDRRKTVKFFTKDQLTSGDDVSSAALTISAYVLRLISRRDDRILPDLVHIGAHDGEGEWCLYDVFLELAPGLRISVDDGLPEDLSPDMTEEEREAVDVDAQLGVIEFVEEALEACMPNVARLSAIVHRVRQRVRRILAEWNRDGIQGRLVDVHLAPFDHWRGNRDPGLIIVLEALGERLVPELIELEVEDPDAVAAELSQLRDTAAIRRATTAELMAKGASGTISRIALNAIDSFGDREATLRRFATEWRFCLPDDTAIMLRDGDVDAGSGRPGDPVDWYGGCITLDADSIPAGRLDTAVGRPVTEVVDFEYLSDDMIVTAVASDSDDGRPRTTIHVDMPRLLFCSNSGRVWTEEEAAAEVRDGGARKHDNVVAFRRRAGR